MNGILSVLVGLVIGIPLALVIMVFQRRRFIKNFPAEDRKLQLLSVVSKMRQEGRNYADRLAYLQGQGLRKDVADILLGEAERSDH
jgi:hypothetical protein